MNVVHLCDCMEFMKGIPDKYYELAKKYGMQQSTVYNWIRREGIQKRGKISNTAKDPETGKFCKSV